MAGSANSIASSVFRSPQRLSDTILKRAKSPMFQIANITGNTRRSKSAVPRWYKKMSLESNNTHLNKQHSGMSPSSRFVTSTKNGIMVKSNFKGNDVVQKQDFSNLQNNFPKGLSEGYKSKIPTLRSRSIPRYKEGSVLMMDRESDQMDSTDYKQFRTRCTESVSASSSDENALDKGKVNSVQNVLNSSAEEIKKNPMSELQVASNNKDPTAAFQRTVNISLHDLDPELKSMTDVKKTLSMDINVVVSVKPPEKGSTPEIGFLSGKQDESKLNMKSTEEVIQIENSGKIVNEQDDILKLKNREIAQNLKFGIEEGLLSQKNLTEEIGNVYKFLKTAGGSKIIDRSSSSILRNYDAIKNLYMNALGCVKAYRQLKNGTDTKEYEPESPEFKHMLEELERCFSNESESSYLSTLPHVGERQGFLGRRPDIMGVRMYSTKSDCDQAKKLPCLQSSEVSSKGAQAADGKSVCEKMCMPCCKPARDPPRCFYPYRKPDCKKLRAPRPAFSECKQLFEMKQVQVCECVKPRASSCKKSAESETCHKK